MLYNFKSIPSKTSYSNAPVSIFSKSISFFKFLWYFL